MHDAKQEKHFDWSLLQCHVWFLATHEQNQHKQRGTLKIACLRLHVNRVLENNFSAEDQEHQNLWKVFAQVCSFKRHRSFKHPFSPLSVLQFYPKWPESKLSTTWLRNETRCSNCIQTSTVMLGKKRRAALRRSFYAWNRTSRPVIVF